MKYSLSEIANIVGGEVRGDESIIIEGLATLKSAGSSQLSFLANKAYAKQLADTSAAAVLIAPEFVDQCPTNAILVPNPYYAYATLTAVFDQAPGAIQGIAPSAIVSEKADLGAGVTICSGAVVGDNVSLGDNTYIGPGAVIQENTILGSQCRIEANVTIYHGCVIGDDVRIHSGAVIGADGFGFAPTKEGWLKIHQLGGVRIGSRVDIGANTTIDRGALDDTIIEDDVIIDNLVQIAHNVQIGEGSAIAGCTGIAGSTKIGKRCTLAGAVGVVGHVDICDGVHISGMTMVTKSIDVPGSYSSGVPMSDTRNWKRNAVRFSKLNELHSRVSKLEKDKG